MKFDIFQRIINVQKKGPALNHIVQLCRIVIRCRIFIPLVCHFTASHIRGNIKPKAPNKLRILVLNEDRYKPDLQELGRHCDVELIFLPSRIQSLINSLWLSPLQKILKNQPEAFHLNQHPEIQKCRKDQQRYLSYFIKYLQKKIHLDCIITCSFFYKQDADWIIACRNNHTPFIALHKENMLDPVIQDRNIARWNRMNFQFSGHALIVFNRLAKSTIERAGIADAENIHIAGALRIDTLCKSLDELPKPQKQVTLFSFHHCPGLLYLDNTINYFSNDPNEGFYEYFDLVHGTVGLFAQENPDTQVWIKPKWDGAWIDRIFLAMERMGVDGKKIANLHVGIEKDAQSLIKESSVIIGLNSTTLLEAKLMNRHVITPIFAEASGKYYDDHVYFKKYLNQCFEIVDSTENLTKAIQQQLENPKPPEPLPEEMVLDFLGYIDGKVVERVVKTIRDTIAEVKSHELSC